MVDGQWSVLGSRWLLVVDCWSVVAGRWLLIVCRWSLVVGHWFSLLVVGCLSLVVGR